MKSLKPEPRGLRALEQAIHEDIATLSYPNRPWVPPRHASDGSEILNVAIIGGGQSGLSVAFSLMLDRVDRVLVIDQNPQGFEGPWRTFARMPTLRTKKQIIGPDRELPNLTFQRWYEARFGNESWNELRFIQTGHWASYLAWYRAVLEIPVRNDARVGEIRWSEKERCFALPVQRARDGGGSETIYARKVVLATGIQGSGQWHTPQVVACLDKRFYSHTHENIDFERLRGKRVGVLGAGASAFDNACVALECGASSVDLFFRRPTLPDRNPFQWVEFVGFLKHHADLPDEEKWNLILNMIEVGHQPPPDTLHRAACLPGFRVHPGSPWEKVESVGTKVRVQTPRGNVEFDHLIIGTGFVTDLGTRPELSAVVDQIALWRDRYTPPAARQNEELGRFPYLGRSFEFQEKVSGQAPYISSLFSYTAACLPSIGMGGGTITGLRYSLRRVTEGITRQLYLEDSKQHLKSLDEYRDPELEAAVEELLGGRTRGKAAA
jgi:cation diffusion facilitator CzcD-associated flavoprotein CzcO